MAIKLDIQNVHAGYGAVRALMGVSLELSQGQTVVLLGTNGNGKSTLMKSLIGLVRPTSGRIEVTIDGQRRGALSWAFARAIEGAADANGDEIISKGELERSVLEAINSRTRGLQHPVIRPAGLANLPLIQLQRGSTPTAGK